MFGSFACQLNLKQVVHVLSLYSSHAFIQQFYDQPVLIKPSIPVPTETTVASESTVTLESEVSTEPSTKKFCMSKVTEFAPTNKVETLEEPISLLELLVYAETPETKKSVVDLHNRICPQYGIHTEFVTMCHEIDTQIWKRKYVYGLKNIRKTITDFARVTDPPTVLTKTTKFLGLRVPPLDGKAATLLFKSNKTGLIFNPVTKIYWEPGTERVYPLDEDCCEFLTKFGLDKKSEQVGSPILNDSMVVDLLMDKLLDIPQPQRTFCFVGMEAHPFFYCSSDPLNSSTFFGNVVQTDSPFKQPRFKVLFFFHTVTQTDQFLDPQLNYQLDKTCPYYNTVKPYGFTVTQV